MTTGIPLGGVGPTPPGLQPHHAAARKRTSDERLALALIDSMPRRQVRRRFALELVGRDHCQSCGSADIATWVDGGDPAAADRNEIHAECRACGQFIL